GGKVPTTGMMSIPVRTLSTRNPVSALSNVMRSTVPSTVVSTDTRGRLLLLRAPASQPDRDCPEADEDTGSAERRLAWRDRSARRAGHAAAGVAHAARA